MNKRVISSAVPPSGIWAFLIRLLFCKERGREGRHYFCGGGGGGKCVLGAVQTRLLSEAKQSKMMIVISGGGGGRQLDARFVHR